MRVANEILFSYGAETIENDRVFPSSSVSRKSKRVQSNELPARNSRPSGFQK